jgi:hypothetical protein
MMADSLNRDGNSNSLKQKHNNSIWWFGEIDYRLQMIFPISKMILLLPRIANG